MKGSRGTSKTKVHFKITFLHFSGVTSAEERDEAGKTKKMGQMRKSDCVKDIFD